ncbi:hypothetical protein BDW68DRAFT_153729 [Aspergillus falconensis]
MLVNHAALTGNAHKKSTSIGLTWTWSLVIRAVCLTAEPVRGLADKATPSNDGLNHYANSNSSEGAIPQDC